MTDRTTPTMDEVEDRLRRTFAAHAEDMADGDGADADLFVLEPARAAGRPHRARRSMQAAAAVVLVALAAAGLALRAGGGDDDASGPSVAEDSGEVGAAPGSDVGLALAPRDVIEALQAERHQAAIWLVGMEDAVRVPSGGAAEVRRITDASAGLFETHLTEHAAGGAYAGGLAALDDLGALRAEIDAQPDPRSLANAGVAEAVRDRYAAIIDALLADQGAVALAVDDPVARGGAEAYARGLVLSELEVRLANVVLWGTVMSEMDTPEAVAAASQAHASMRDELDLLVSATAGTPFEDAASAAVAEVEASGLLDVTGETIERGGVADLDPLLAVLDDVADPWPVFLDEVEQALS